MAAEVYGENRIGEGMGECKISLGCIYDKEKGFITLEEHDRQVRTEVINKMAKRIANTDINSSNYPMNQVNLVKMQMLKENK